jgi:hypothetical protein
MAGRMTVWDAARLFNAEPVLPVLANSKSVSSTRDFRYQRKSGLGGSALLGPTLTRPRHPANRYPLRRKML